jgi:KUP system potassium uptake protein
MKLKKSNVFDFTKKNKRADIYWFVHVNILSEPYKTEYKVTEIIKDDLYRVDFNLGFREPTKINLMFKEVIKDMVQKKSGYYQSI